MLYFCQKCCFEIFPFQLLDNSELIRLFSHNDVFFPILSNRFITLNLNSSLRHKQYCDTSNVKMIYKDTFSIMFVNIRSINHNFCFIEELINCIKIKPAIIGVSETWLTNDRPFVHTLPGYNFVHYPSPSNAGGVGFFCFREYHMMLFRIIV